MRLFAALALVIVPSLAFAAPKKPAPASEHKPPVVLDEAASYVELIPQGADGYHWRVIYELNGATSKTDSVRVDWKAGGKVVASQKCSFNLEDKYVAGGCEFREKALKNKGAIEADLIYWDDQEEKDYLVRTFKVTVHHFKGQWETWQIAPDDMLAGGWAYHDGDGDGFGSGAYRRLHFYIGFTNQNLQSPSLRCKVGEKKIADISIGENSGSGSFDVEADHQPKKGDRMTYRWVRMNLNADVFWGTRDTLKYDYGKNSPPDRVLADNPGRWECGLRSDGKTIRQINFTVDKDGMVQNDESNTGKGAIPTVSPKVVFVDVRLTKDSATFDKRINPAAIKKSLPFGLPWPDNPKVKENHASIPAKSGMPDPK